MSNEIEKELDDFDNGIESELDSFESSSAPTETLEDKLGFSRFYDTAGAGIKAIAPLSKPVTAPMAMALETATEGPVAGFDALMEELTQLQPTEKSSFSHQLRKIPSMAEPIMESPIRDISQGEGIKAYLKGWAQKNFPKAYGVASQVSPADMVGMIADVGSGEALAPFTARPIGRALGKVGDYAVGKAINNTEKAIERMSSLSGENASEASNTLRTRKAAMTAMEYGLTNKLKNPEALQLALNGERDIIPDELTGKTSVKTKPGLIDSLTDHVNNLADDISAESEAINVKEIADDVYNKMAEKISDPDSGAVWNEKVSNSLRERITNFFKSTNYGLGDIEELIKTGNIDDAVSLQESYGQKNKRNFKSLIKLKRAAADKVYEINKNPEIYGVEGATDKAIFKEIWDQIDNKVNGMAKGGSDKASELVRFNSELSDMLHLKNMTQKARLEGMASLTMPEMLAGTAATTAAASAAGFPMAGLAYAPARAAMKMGETNIPAYLAPAQETIGKVAYNAMTGANSLSKVPSRFGGLGMAIGGSSNYFNNKANVETYRIPRNSQVMMEDKNFIASKIAKELGPQYANDLMMIEDKDALKLFMRNIELTRPDLFEKDPYARMDGIIDHPILKQKALEDTVKNNQLPVLERANLVEDLLLNNRFLG